MTAGYHYHYDIYPQPQTGVLCASFRTRYWTRMPSDDPLTEAISALEVALCALREVQARSVAESSVFDGQCDDTFAGEHLIAVPIASERFGLPQDTLRLWCRLTQDSPSPLGEKQNSNGRWRVSVQRLRARLGHRAASL